MHGRFRYSRSLPVATAGVCPDSPLPAIAAPSRWAQANLSFPFTPRQLEVLDSPSPYLILCCSRQWGKTTTIACKALYHALHHPEQSLVVLSRSTHQAALLINIFSTYAQKLGFPIRRHLGRRESFVLPNGSHIVAVPHNENTLAGHTAHVFIVDEAARVSDEVYFTAAASLTRTQGSIWLLSTPKSQTGFFYNYWHSQDPQWHRIFSTVADCPGIDPVFLATQQVSNPTLYAQDFECRFLAPGAALVSRDFVNRMLYSPSELEKLYFGLDLGQRRDHSAFVALRLHWVPLAGQFRPELEICSVDRFPLGTCYDALSQVVLDRIALAATECDPTPERHLIIDASGPGSPVVDRLRKVAPASLNLRPVLITGGQAVNVLAGGYTGIPRRALLSTVLYAIGAASLRCAPGLAGWNTLVEELVRLRAGDMQPDGPGAHDDVVVALALAVHAAVSDTPQLLPDPRDLRPP